MAFANGGAAMPAHADEKAAGSAPHFVAVGFVITHHAGKSRPQTRKNADVALDCARQVFARTHLIALSNLFSLEKGVIPNKNFIEASKSAQIAKPRIWCGGIACTGANTTPPSKTHWLHCYHAFVTEPETALNSLSFCAVLRISSCAQNGSSCMRTMYARSCSFTVESCSRV